MDRLFFTFIILVFLLSSCSSSKNILYVQDLNNNSELKSNYVEYLIKVDDILKIDIKPDHVEVTKSFSPDNLVNSKISSKDDILFNGYKVDVNGNISFPSIGLFSVQGKSINQIRDEIYNFLINNGFFTKPHVDIKLANAHFSIIGEVNSPGRYEFLKNNLNIFEAIAISGDLTITAKRDDILLIREVDNKKMVFNIDLTSSNFIQSKSYQIFSGDVIIVNPNKTRIKNAGVIGNSGTLLSLLSFILSSIIVISN
tara:strand:- start:4119 stop:4883 length:765 start_codon:yes stop_codon:yes gene_type:complete